MIAAAALMWGSSTVAARPLRADTSATGWANPLEATTSLAARRDAVQSIPFDKLDDQAAAKINAVLSNVTVFRRLPVRVVNCDPELYLFLVRHPDVVVSIWEVLKLGQMQVRQIGSDTYRVVEPDGSQTVFQYVYRSHDTHIIYGEGSYAGPLLPAPIKGRCVLILKSGYVRETDGRYYITSRLDGFVSVERGGAELLTKTVHALMGKIVDANFSQTVAFLGSLSHTAEVNAPGVQRLADKLVHVQPQYRQQFAELAVAVAERSASHASLHPAAEQHLIVRRGESEGALPRTGSR